MKLFKFLFLCLLTSCSQALPAAPVVDADIPVERIITDEPVVSVIEDNYHKLNYNIYPYDATDKTIRVDDTYLWQIAEIVIDDYNNVFVIGKTAGIGLLSIVTSNNKFVSYSITVIAKEPTPGPEPKLFLADDIAEYFNSAAAEAGLELCYNLENQYWYLVHNFGLSVSESEESLKEAVDYFKPFLPKYIFKLYEKYVAATDDTIAEYDLVMVNSNIFTEIDIWSYIENEELIAQVKLYNIND